MKKITGLFLVLLLTILITACDPETLNEINENIDQELSEMVRLELNEETLEAEYELGAVDLSSINMDVYVDDVFTETISFDWNMINVTDYQKLLTVGTHTIQVTYLSSTLDLTIVITDSSNEESMYLYTFILVDESNQVLSEIRMNDIRNLFIPIYQTDESYGNWYMDANRTIELTMDQLEEGVHTLYLKMISTIEDPNDDSNDDPNDDPNDEPLLIPDELPTDIEINLVMWTVMGSRNSELIEMMFEDFQLIYPNVSLTLVNQGSYTQMRESMLNAIRHDITPSLFMGFPEHMLEYASFNASLSLDDYINHESHGIDTEDFIQAFMDEVRDQNGITYSMPFSKATDVLTYNKTVFDYHGIDLSNRTTAVTWDEIDAWAELLVGDGEMQCEFMLVADSPANLFMNSSYQWGVSPTNANGELFINNETIFSMLEAFQTRFLTKTIAFPIEWNQLYGSTNFLEGNACISLGSTAGVRYNIPSYHNQVDSKFGVFEVGVIPMVQKETCPLTFELNTESFNPNCVALFTGPNIAISTRASEYERLAAWLFLKHITNTENTTLYAMHAGTIPLRLSALNSTVYQDFYGSIENDDFAYARTAEVIVNQAPFYHHETVFIEPYKSSDVRNELKVLFEAIYNGADIEISITEFLSQFDLDSE